MKLVRFQVPGSTPQFGVVLEGSVVRWATLARSSGAGAILPALSPPVDGPDGRAVPGARAGGARVSRWAVYLPAGTAPASSAAITRSSNGDPHPLARS